MSVIDRSWHANESYAEPVRLGNVPMPPARKLAIVACMDARPAPLWRQALASKTGRRIHP